MLTGPPAAAGPDRASLNAILAYARLKGLRLGVFQSCFFRNLDADTVRRTEAAPEVLRSASGEIVEWEKGQA